MRESTYIYGCVDADIDAIAVLVAPQLKLRLENRDSSYWGEYYIDRSDTFSEVMLYRNRDPMYQPGVDDPAEYWFEPEFRDYSSLLSVYASDKHLDEFHAKLATVSPTFRLLKPSTLKVK